MLILNMESQNLTVLPKSRFSFSFFKLVIFLFTLSAFSLIGVGIYYLNVKKKQVGNETEVCDNCEGAIEEEKHFEGVDYYQGALEEKKLLGKGGVVEKIDLEQKTLALKNQETVEEVGFENDDLFYVFYGSKPEDIRNRSQIDFSEVKIGDSIFCTPLSPGEETSFSCLIQRVEK